MKIIKEHWNSNLFFFVFCIQCTELVWVIIDIRFFFPYTFGGVNMSWVPPLCDSLYWKSPHNKHWNDYLPTIVDDKEHHSVSSILLPSYQISACHPHSGETNKRFAFKAEHNNMKTCFFASDNQVDMERWINALKLAAALKGVPKYVLWHQVLSFVKSWT